MRCIFSLALLATLLGAGEPVHLDLGPALNTAAVDDGIPGNGQGGWTDEGINDMFTYPPPAPGVQEVNGVRFRLADPAQHGGRAAAVLRGHRMPGAPASLEIAGGGAVGRFVYLVLHGISRPEGLAKEAVVATWRLDYADGSSASGELRSGREVRHWWAGAWWDNSGAEAWPVLMGQNPYTAKWGSWIGLWATRLEHPHPQRPIAKLTLTSLGTVAIAVWAATVDERDYASVLGEGFKLSRPPGAPAGYFDERLAIENRQVGNEMRRLGLTRGVRSLEVIRPDLLAVTIDAAVSDGPGPGAAAAAALQTPERFAVTGREPLRVERVGRQSILHETADAGIFPSNHIHWHTYFLRLSRALAPGETARVAVAGLPQGCVASSEVVFDPAATISPAIKVNQGAYAPGRRRFAYIGWWAGDLGQVDFADCTAYEVVSEADRSVVLAGAVAARRATEQSKRPPAPDGHDPISGELVREIELSALPPGRYHLRVPGLGRSWPFAVGGEAQRGLALTLLRGLLHQRCGCELTPAITAYPRPACHVAVYEHGHLVGGLMEHRVDGVLTVANPPLRPDEPIRRFHGGYHDAADFDLFAGHLQGAARLLDAYEAAPAAWAADDLGLPESGNGVPDLLDEVLWGISFYAAHQQADGGIPAGRGNDEDYQRKEWQHEGAPQHGANPPFGVFPPTRSSTATFAAAAAQLARALAPHDAKRAADLLAQAERAWVWAAADTTDAYRNAGVAYAALSWPRTLFWAAAELWEGTGAERYRRHLEEHREDPQIWRSTWKDAAIIPLLHWSVAKVQRPGLPAGMQDAAKAAILAAASGARNSIERPSYRLSARPDGAGGWGSLAGGAEPGTLLLLAWRLTGDAAWLDAASLGADYQLGCNPLGRSFISRIGAHPPERPQLRPWLYDADRRPSPGVPIYGPGGGPKAMRDPYPAEVPPWRCYQDNASSSTIHSEFDVVRQQGMAAFYAMLWGAAAGGK